MTEYLPCDSATSEQCITVDAIYDGVAPGYDEAKHD